MDTHLTELDKLLLHTFVSTLQAQRTRTIQADISFLYDLGYTEDQITQSLEKLKYLDPATALAEARKLEEQYH